MNGIPGRLLLLVTGMVLVFAFGCAPGADRLEADVAPTTIVTIGGSPGLIDDFDGGTVSEAWWSYDEDGTFSCEPAAPGHDSPRALLLVFNVPADSYPGCGVHAGGASWRDRSGLGFWWRSDRAGLVLEVILQMEDASQTGPDLEGLTPFTATLETPGDEWELVSLPWSAFAKADWVGPAGTTSLDPGDVVELLFEVGESQQGNIWIDELRLLQSRDTVAPGGDRPKTGTVDKFALWLDGPQLRGANIWQRVVVPEIDGDEFLGPARVGPPFSQQDFDRLASLGANYVNISTAGLFTESPPYQLDEAVQQHLDELLAMIEAADMFAVISFRTGPGRSDFTFYSEGIEEWGDPSLLNDQVWVEVEAQDAWVEMWRHTASSYRGNPIVVGYDLMVEPNAEEVFFGVYEPDEFFPEHAGSLYDWNQLHPRISAAIREVDPDTPILTAPSGYSGVSWLPYLEPSGDPRTVYTIHHYDPFDYTHQLPPLTISYPGEMDLDYDGAADSFDEGALERLLANVDAFQGQHGGAMAVNEFGPMRWQPGAAAFMRDQMEVFERRGMNHALWVFNPSWPPYQQEEDDHFDFLHGPDPDRHADVDNSELLEVITSFWARNAVRPSALAGPDRSQVAPPSARQVSQRIPALGGVTSWFYYLDVNLEPETVEQIATSSFDMVVLDFIPSEANNTDYPMAAVVDRLHGAAHPKLVLAYIDIGQAESFRSYWPVGWRVGDPEWIVGSDPDGWAENFPVAYWYDEWQALWLGERGLLAAIVEAGFDGVYLDWIEAYSDDNVAALAERQGLDPRQEMIWWVEDIAEFTRARRPGFLVVAQNAAELTQDGDYLDVIDALAQEQVWFDGGADNDPPGDCPLPRTEAEVETEAYLAQLSRSCRRLYSDFPDSTLHVSSESYLEQLTRARDQGLVVLTVDYALEPENVAWVYQTSRDLGFVPFVSNRALDRFVEPTP